MPIAIIPPLLVPVPPFVAAGNTLSVAQDGKSMSGVLVAKAFVAGVHVGTVRLTLKRINNLPTP